MKYRVSFDDSVYTWGAIVEAPRGTDEITLLEIATKEYKLGDLLSRDYVNSGEAERKLRSWGYSDDNIEEFYSEIYYSEEFGAYLCI